MADDPMLAEAVERFIAVGGPFYRLELGSAFRAGWESCLRSLGAATPEAVAALRALARATQVYIRLTKPKLDARFGLAHRDAASDAFDALVQALRAFALLATPTEGGR